MQSTVETKELTDEQIAIINSDGNIRINTVTGSLSHK
jgi:hypothetical protein